MKLRQLISLLQSKHAHSLVFLKQGQDIEVTGIACDSKKVSPGFIFTAIKGNRADGHQYIDEAIERGAAAVITQEPMPPLKQADDATALIKAGDSRKAFANLCAEFYANPSEKIKTVGITGTNGKTTVSYLIEAVLKNAGFEPAVIGTINYRYKNKVTPSSNTTPGPLELQSMFSDMLKEGVNYAAMEVSSHALDQGRTDGINFSCAIFTNLAQDHLDYHRDKENYFQAKLKLFTGLKTSGYAAINADDEYAARIKSQTRARLISYGIVPGADIAAQEIKCGGGGLEFRLTTPKSSVALRTPLIGRYNVYNILACASWAFSEGLDLECLAHAIKEFHSVPGRLEKINSAAPFNVFVDYAHTEDALKNVIASLRELTDKKIIVVFGCGGDRDRDKRPKMGRVVSKMSDYAIVTNDNPRSEDPLEIIEDIKRGITKNNYCVIPERKEAISRSLSLAASGDIVLIAGKGHENYQILRDKTYHFDDCEVVGECLKYMKY